MRTVAVALLLVLAACGGGSEGGASDPAPTEAPSTKTTRSSAAPPLSAPTGVPVPEALSRFRCEQDDEGAWNAAGFVANTAKTPTTFQVTVHVGDASGGSARAKTKQVPRVAAGGSVAFKIFKVPAPDDGGPCHVQVLATPS